MRYRLRTTFRAFTTGLISSVGLATLVVAWFDGQATVRESAHALIEEIAEAVEVEVSEHLEVPDRTLRLVTRMMADGALDPADLKKVATVLTDFLEIHQEISGLEYRSVAGSSLQILRDPDGRLLATSKSAAAAEPAPDWFSHWTDDPPAVEGESPYWGSAAVRHDLGVPAVTGSRPVVSPEWGLVGVMAVEVSLLDVSRFMAGLKIGVSGEAFLVNRQRQLIAIADTLALLRPKRFVEELAFHELSFAHRPEVAVFGERPEVAATLGGDPATRTRFVAGDVEYLGSLGPLDTSPGGGWYVGVIAPEDDFLGELKRTILIGFAVLIGALILAGILADRFSRYLAQSLSGVVNETERIGELDFRSSGEPQAVFRELYDVLVAFESMKVGVRSFSRYVPVKVVRRLIESGNDARSGGEVRTLTLLFSDIADFTTLSEGVGPDRLTEKLNAYFAGVTRAIDGCGGLLDKYMGDGIMAFWGAPEAIDDHSSQGLEAALRATEWLASLPADHPAAEFRTRFGIHTGPVLVGNIGGEERLNYTCIGESVNLASRIEGLNKIFGTGILITGQTEAALGAGYETRQLDTLVVKGATEATVVYEVLGRTGEVQEDVLRRSRIYEEALGLYRAREFGEAATRLETIADTDPAATTLLGRCQAFAADPPDESWNGAFRLLAK